jgi:hypothetical protein
MSNRAYYLIMMQSSLEFIMATYDEAKAGALVKDVVRVDKSIANINKIKRIQANRKSL